MTRPGGSFYFHVSEDQWPREDGLGGHIEEDIVALQSSVMEEIGKPPEGMEVRQRYGFVSGAADFPIMILEFVGLATVFVGGVVGWIDFARYIAEAFRRLSRSKPEAVVTSVEFAKALCLVDLEHRVPSLEGIHVSTAEKGDQGTFFVVFRGEDTTWAYTVDRNGRIQDVTLGPRDQDEEK